MKLFTKVFLCTLSVLTLALGAAGYSLICASFDAALQRETDRALEQYQLLKFSLQSAILGAYEMGTLTDEALEAFAGQTLQLAPEGTLAGVYRGPARVPLLSGPAVPWSAGDIGDIPNNEVRYRLQAEEGGNRYLVVLGSFTQSGQPITLCTALDVNAVFAECDRMLSAYQTIYGVVILVGAAVMAVLFGVLMGPMKKLTQAACRMADGQYSQRVEVTTGDEIGVLAMRFNRMADTIEDTIHELERAARQKEDFVAGFAHELKTPLTSVIGYADMIYQKELTRPQVREAAAYILNEGMRLEALSFKLLELIVLDREDFVLEEFRADELLKDIGDSLAPVMEKNGVRLELAAGAAWVRVEYDLIKTLLLNLIDNAVKADSVHIRLSGEPEGDRYVVTVADDGRGMDRSELSRITEAFYRVDKSRSRRQHGAGLGLSIATRIARIHGTRLEYESAPGEGTAVSFALPAGGGAP